MTAADIELLREFVTDEAASLAQKRQGKFWPQNHHRLRPLLPKVAKLLEPSDYEDFLFHLMRVTGGVPAIVQKDVPILLSAYRRLIPYLDLGGIVQMARRHEMLFLFGFDDNGALPDGMLTSAQDLKARLRLLRRSEPTPPNRHSATKRQDSSLSPERQAGCFRPCAISAIVMTDGTATTSTTSPA